MGKRRDKYKLKQVAKEYVRNGFYLTDAFRKIENRDYKGKRTALSVKSHRWRHSKDFMEAVDKELQKFDKSLISPEFIMGKLYELVNDNQVKPADKVGCLALCCKIIGLAKDNQIANIQIVGQDKLKDIINTISVKRTPESTAGIVPNDVVISEPLTVGTNASACTT